MENNYLTLLMAVFFLGSSCSFTKIENTLCYWENEECVSKTESQTTVRFVKKRKEVSKRNAEASINF